jgi:hypothetical protein
LPGASASMVESQQQRNAVHTTAIKRTIGAGYDSADSAGVKRDSYVLATKLYFPMSDTDRGLSSAQIHKHITADNNVMASGHPVPSAIFDDAQRIMAAVIGRQSSDPERSVPPRYKSLPARR